MNYGYNEKTKDWKENRKMTLAFELAKELNLVIGWAGAKAGEPYIEVNGGYGGVRIRRITHLSEQVQKSIVENADKVYDLIMNQMLV